MSYEHKCKMLVLKVLIFVNLYSKFLNIFLTYNCYVNNLHKFSIFQTHKIKHETVIDFIFLCSKITTDNDHSPEIQRCLLLGRKAVTKLDSTLKSRDISLQTKVHLVKAMGFPVSCIDVKVGP